MSALVTRQRRLNLIMLAVTLSTIVAVPLLGYAGVRAVLESTGGRDARADNLPIQSFPVTPAAAWFITDDDGELAAAAILVLDPSLRGGSLVDVPVNADVGAESGLQRGLYEVFAEQGAEGALLAVEALTSLTLAYGFDSDADGVQATIAPVGSISVELVADVEVPGWTAPLVAGATVLDAATAAAVLADSPVRSAVGFDEHRRNVNAVWAGLSGANGGGSRPVSPERSVPADEGEFFDRFFSGPVGTRPILAVPIRSAGSTSEVDLPTAGGASATSLPEPATTDGSAPLTPDEGGEAAEVVRPELVAVDRADSVFVFASIAPASMSAPAAGPMFRLEAPPGYDAQVLRTVGWLLYFGANVVSIDSTNELRPDTVFVVPDTGTRSAVESFDVLFGELAFADPSMRIDGVDITVELGTEYLEALEV